MKINREELLQKLECIQPGIASKETIEQSNCFVFQNGMVSAFNDEMCCRIPSGMDKSFTAAVKADSLLAILHKLSEDELEGELKDGKFYLQGKGRTTYLRVEEEIILPLDAVEKPTEWSPLHEDFGEAVGLVGRCAGKGDFSSDSACVHIGPKWIEAYDNFQLCRWRLQSGFKKDALIKQSCTKHLTPLGLTEVSETSTWVHFRNPGKLVISCRRYLVEDFPDLSKFLKVEGIATTLSKSLAEAVDKAQIFSKENTEGDYLHVEIKKGRLTLTGEGLSGGHEERKKLNYDGPPLTFVISPEILKDIVTRHTECTLSEDRLKVNGGKYIYVACLIKPQGKRE